MRRVHLTWSVQEANDYMERIRKHKGIIHAITPVASTSGFDGVAFCIDYSIYDTKEWF